MGRSDSLAHRPNVLPSFRVVRPYPLRETRRVSQVHASAFVAIPRSQTPGRIGRLAMSPPPLPLSSTCTLSALPMLNCFGAQSLHLRYGLATPFLWLQTVCCLPVCTFGNRVLAWLSLCRTLTDCISHALLGALMPTSFAFILNHRLPLDTDPLSDTRSTRASVRRGNASQTAGRTSESRRSRPSSHSA